MPSPKSGIVVHQVFADFTDQTLAEEPASPGLRRAAMLIGPLYVMFVLATLAIPDMRLTEAPQAATIYGAGLLITEASTAFLLFGLAAHSRLTSVLFLACAYLFSALMALLHLLAFPGALIPGQSLIDGPNSVGFLFLLWKLGFPVIIILGLLTRLGGPRPMTLRHPTTAVTVTVAITVAITAGAALVATVWQSHLPNLIVNQGRFSDWNVIGSWIAIAAHAAAFILAAAIGRARQTLYVWLSLAMLAFAGELLLTTIAGGRYTLDWYAGRASGLLAACALFLLFLSRFAQQNRNLLHSLNASQRQAHALQAEVRRREEAEHRLLQSQKMEALGQLTGGIAHDFNNLLLVISGRLGLLSKSLTDPALIRHMTSIEQALTRCEALTRQLLSFSRRRPIQKRTIQIATEVPRIGDLLRPSLRGDIQLAWDVAADIWPIEADPGELDLALLNTALNARDAMPKGGQLRISINNATLPADPAVGLTGGGFVCIAIADTGAGIPPDVLPRVFEPFFTTKEVGRGTGLGLSQVYAFARQCGGVAAIASEPGSGTTLTLHLPRVEARTPLPASLEVAVQIPLPQGIEILLVEDNEAVADAVTAMLDDVGCHIRRVPDARSALALLANNSCRPALVLSDIVMPGGLDGLDLARMLRTQRPELPIVLSTGYSSASQDAMADGFTVLLKPYTRQDAARSIADAIAGQSRVASS